MKKIILLLVATTFLSCSLDDNNKDNYQYDVLAVKSYVLPDTLTLGKTYKIELKYQKPTICYMFQGIYYAKELNKRVIGIQTAVNLNQECSPTLPPLSEVSFDFIPTEKGSYIFKFYKGKDDKEEAVFEEVEIPVAK